MKTSRNNFVGEMNRLIGLFNGTSGMQVSSKSIIPLLDK